MTFATAVASSREAPAVGASADSRPIMDFPSSFRVASTTPERLHQSLTSRLEALRAGRATHPLANPVQALALELTREIDTGGVTLSDIEQLIKRLVGIAFVERAERLGVY